MLHSILSARMMLHLREAAASSCTDTLQDSNSLPPIQFASIDTSTDICPMQNATTISPHQVDQFDNHGDSWFGGNACPSWQQCRVSDVQNGSTFVILLVLAVNSETFYTYHWPVTLALHYLLPITNYSFNIRPASITAERSQLLSIWRKGFCATPLLQSWRFEGDCIPRQFQFKRLEEGW